MTRQEVAREAFRDITDEDRALLPLLISLAEDARVLARRSEVARQKAHELGNALHRAEHRASEAQGRLHDARTVSLDAYSQGVRAMRDLACMTVRKMVGDRDLAAALVELLRVEAVPMLVDKGEADQ